MRPPSPPPADVKPYWDKGTASSPVPSAREVFPENSRKGKKSRRAQAVALSIDQGPATIPAAFELSCGVIGLQIDDTEVQPKQKPPVFFVSKKAYDVFEMILEGHKGQLSFDDLKSVSDFTIS